MASAIRRLQRDLENKANDLSRGSKKELDLLKEGANVCKLIGLVLVKPDLAEANANVRKRIQYNSTELKQLDAALQYLEEKQNSKKDAILKVQQRIQSLRAGKAKA